MQERLYYIKGSNGFMLKTKDLKQNPLLVTANDVGLHLSIPHETGLVALRQVLDRKNKKRTSTKDLVKMAEFVLKSTTLNLMAKVNTKYRAQSLGQNLFLLMLAFLCIKQKPSFLKARNLSHWYGFDIRIMLPSFGHIGKKNLRCFSITLLTMTLILNLSVV